MFAEDGAAGAALQGRLDAVVADLPVVTVKDEQAFAAEQRAPIDRIIYIIYVLLVFAVVIAVLGIVNTLALSVHDHQLRRQLGAMIAVLGGVDGVAFSGGVGEGSPRTRAAACSSFEFAGIHLDPDRNESCAGAEPVDTILTAPDAAVAGAVVHSREDLEMVRDARAALAARTS